jgi:hypothetical protein
MARHKAHEVTPTRLAELKAEAFKTPEERAAELRELATVRPDDGAAKRQAQEAYRAHVAAERKARFLHAAKRMASLGLIGSYDDRQIAIRRRAEQEAARVREVERAALEADPEYAAVMRERHIDHTQREAATYLTTKDGRHAGNLRLASLNASSARRQEVEAAEAEAAGDTVRAERLRRYAAGNMETANKQQREAEQHMGGSVEDNGAYLDFGVGRPRYGVSEADTMAGIHTIALEENAHQSAAAHGGHPPVSR